MTSEEYIKKCGLEELISETISEKGVDWIKINEVEDIVIKFCKAEREKAMSAFDEVITYALLRRSEGERIRIETMKEQFKELLNK